MDITHLEIAFVFLLTGIMAGAFLNSLTLKENVLNYCEDTNKMACLKMCNELDDPYCQKIDYYLLNLPNDENKYK